MSDEIRCKRIIDGKTYNTETATLLGQWEDDCAPIEQAIFKTRHGAYFLWTLQLLSLRGLFMPSLNAHAAIYLKRLWSFTKNGTMTMKSVSNALLG